jgi:hypothetical protein
MDVFVLIIVLFSCGAIASIVWLLEHSERKKIEQEKAMISEMFRDLTIGVASQVTIPMPRDYFTKGKGKVSITPEDYAFELEREARWRYAYRHAFSKDPDAWSFNGGSFKSDVARNNDSPLAFVNWPWSLSMMPEGLDEGRATVLVKLAFGDRSNVA